MRQTHSGRLPLLVAPAFALVATLLLVALAERTGPVLLWGGLATLVSAVPFAVPQRHLHPAVWACAALVTVLVVLGSASIGFFYAPAAIALPLSRYLTAEPDGGPRPRGDDPCDRNPRENALRDRG
ncbi:hypothetical protein [Nocardiopsis ganjiahuensis]|uniref:hypothetical protein n=1 Tax=Nocardiopsis ganjiahuensis TaxID=239984 RepID=UPI00034CAAE3|nr:hypothetical protein [Nocardiopsis ganjiahuensis]